MLSYGVSINPINLGKEVIDCWKDGWRHKATARKEKEEGKRGCRSSKKGRGRGKIFLLDRSKLSVKNRQMMQKTTMGVKRVETLGKTLIFQTSWKHSPPPNPPKNVHFFYFLDCTGNRAYTALNWGGRAHKRIDPRKETLEKHHFLSVSPIFVVHCSKVVLIYHQILRTKKHLKKSGVSQKNLAN